VSTAPTPKGGTETVLPGGLMHVLKRWEALGGGWAILKEHDAWLTVGLRHLDGNGVVSSVTGSRTSAPPSRSHLRDRHGAGRTPTARACSQTPAPQAEPSAQRARQTRPPHSRHIEARPAPSEAVFGPGSYWAE
jgi:hypothetical protein